MTTDLKTSILVERQVPEFVREEYPTFVKFLEAYYEFLDQNLMDESKRLRYISDVDESLDDFQQHFFNSFIPFIPEETSVSKDLIIKNILPIYLSKGSPKSFELLFALLFGNRIDIEYPKDSVLKASDGRWIIENVLRIVDSIDYKIIGDGTTTTFLLPYEVDSSDFYIEVDGVLVTNYSLRKEIRKVVFNTAPADGAIIKIIFNNFDITVLNNRQVIGQYSGATAIIERSSLKTTLSTNFYELFINNQTLLGDFENGEIVTCIYFDSNRNRFDFELSTFADVDTIRIVNAGHSYNIGDSVRIVGSSNIPATAVVDGIISGVVEQIIIEDGGIGFKVGNNVRAFISGTPVSSNSFYSNVQTVDTTVTPNTVNVWTDTINAYSAIALNATNYGFPSNTSPTGNVYIDTVLDEAFAEEQISGLGSITSILIDTSTLSTGSGLTFDVDSPMTAANVQIKQYGIIGKIEIVSSGTDYEVGDQLVFVPTGYTGEQGANVVVSSVGSNGEIVDFEYHSGGVGYTLEYPPSISVASSNGTGAVLTLSAIMGDGEILTAQSPDGLAGAITSIKVLSGGNGYTTEPDIDLTRIGSGTATATATIRNSLTTLPGRWKTSDGFLSSMYNKLQGGNYYHDMSYVVSSRVEFDVYRDLVKKVLHPSGLIAFARYQIEDVVDYNVSVSVANSSINKTISGFVSVVNGSIEVTGTNTAFEVTNTSGILVTGNTIIVNNETAVVNSIISNTTIDVVSPFTSNSANVQLKIII